MHTAVIPARGGSKRLPRKNIKLFNGVPMISYAIQTAMNTGIYDRIIVSTDDDEIASLAKQSGAEVPFRRGANLSDDKTPTVPVIKDAILRSFQPHEFPEFVTALYPCTPLLTTNDLKAAARIINKTDACYVFPVCNFPSPPQRALRMNKLMNTTSVDPSFSWTRTQDIEPLFYDAGQFYCGKLESWMNSVELHNNSEAIVIPSWRAIDIDTSEDWKFAELIYQTISSTSTNDET